MVGVPVRQCNKGQWSELRFNCSGKCITREEKRTAGII